nr:vig2, isoform D [Drosophila melanogaster]NP_733084.1 vig2, isoform A [Drosophila melanogaster]NP_733085.1 vig2, isoform C [Drosophila melanogaster]ACL90643.1 CG11844-PA [synthetic construct]AAK93541.1 SD06613p [Drosophila melanogaster]AAN14040.1 vig2, isoform A [Drosophila melanogaster]AAN14041.1 vig2, isoform C [Drosophila melanogaster]ABW08755.1 vig2, isoform D [Drosophila melanogaster]|eukprot:NP_001097913.1 vig2, isoform D [Drosophila melanogaster]
MDNSGNNRYELLFMDDDDSSGLAQPQIAAVVAAPKKPEPAKAPKAPKSKSEKENKPVVAARKANAPVAKNASPVKGGKGPAGGDVGRPKNPTANGANNQGRFNNNQRYGNKESNGEFGNELPQRQFNNRDNRGPPRVRTGEKFGKREFDRQSGSDRTGVKSIDKREGGGAHNWGSPKQDIEDLKTTGETSPQAEKEDSANEQSADPAVAAEEDESKQMTLDEWKALRDQRAKPNYNLRKAGEGAADNAEWKKMIVLSKKKESNSEDELEYDPSLYPQRVGRLQRIVDIQFNFNDGRKVGFRKGPRPGAGPREGGFRNDGPRGEGGYRNDGPRGEGGYRNDGPRGEGPRNEGPRGEGYRNDGPRGEGFRGPRFNNGPSNGYENRQDNNRFGEKRRSAQKPLKVDDEAQFPTLC